MDIEKDEDLLNELRIILGMINETQAKGRLLLNKSEITEEEVSKLEHEAVCVLSKFAEWQIKANELK